jgi:hypothetical protein
LRSLLNSITVKGLLMSEKTENKVSIEDMEAGKSYACFFEAYTMLNEQGLPARGQIGQSFPGPGNYQGFGLITKRDLENKKLIVIDIDTKYDFVVPFDSVWGIDEAEAE